MQVFTNPNHSDFDQVIQLVDNAQDIVAVVGAGISVSSGIPVSCLWLLTLPF
jgi:hypothetical protein